MTINDTRALSPADTVDFWRDLVTFTNISIHSKIYSAQPYGGLSTLF